MLIGYGRAAVDNQHQLARRGIPRRRQMRPCIRGDGGRVGGFESATTFGRILDVRLAFRQTKFKTNLATDLAANQDTAGIGCGAVIAEPCFNRPCGDVINTFILGDRNIQTILLALLDVRQNQATIDKVIGINIGRIKTTIHAEDGAGLVVPVFDTVCNTVVIRVRIHRVGADELFVEVGQSVAVGIPIRIIHSRGLVFAVGVRQIFRVGNRRIRTSEIFIEVGQTVAIQIGSRVSGVFRIKAILLFPFIGHAVAIRIGQVTGVANFIHRGDVINRHVERSMDGMGETIVPILLPRIVFNRAAAVIEREGMEQIFIRAEERNRDLPAVERERTGLGDDVGQAVRKRLFDFIGRADGRPDGQIVDETAIVVFALRCILAFGGQSTANGQTSDTTIGRGCDVGHII